MCLKWFVLGYFPGNSGEASPLPWIENRLLDDYTKEADISLSPGTDQSLSRVLETSALLIYPFSTDARWISRHRRAVRLWKVHALLNLICGLLRQNRDQILLTATPVTSGDCRIGYMLQRIICWSGGQFIKCSSRTGNPQGELTAENLLM